MNHAVQKHWTKYGGYLHFALGKRDMSNEIREKYLGVNGSVIAVAIMVGFTAYLEKLCVARVKQDRSNGVNGYD